MSNAAIAWYSAHEDAAAADPMSAYHDPMDSDRSDPADVRRQQLHDELDGMRVFAGNLLDHHDPQVARTAKSLITELDGKVMSRVEMRHRYGAAGNSKENVWPREYPDDWVTPQDIHVRHIAHGKTICTGRCGSTVGELIGRTCPVDIPSDVGFSACPACFTSHYSLQIHRRNIGSFRKLVEALDVTVSGPVDINSVRMINDIDYPWQDKARQALRDALGRRAAGTFNRRVSGWGVRVAAELLDPDLDDRMGRAGRAMATRIASNGTLDIDQLVTVGVDAADGPFTRRATIEARVRELLSRAGQAAAERDTVGMSDGGYVRLREKGTDKHPALWLLAEGSGIRNSKAVAGWVHDQLMATGGTK